MTKRTSSAVWDYFEIRDEATPNIANCKLCEKPISRGSSKLTKKQLTVSSMWGHLKAKHEQEFKDAKQIQKGNEEKRQKIHEEHNEQKQIYVLSKAQPTLAETLERKKKWEPSNPDQTKADTLCAYWLCDALLPYATTENEQFCKFIAHLQSRYSISSEKVLRQRIIPEINKKVQYHVKESLDKNTVGVYALTTDIWSSKSKHSFISYTAHFITVDWKRKVVILRCMSYDSKHSASSICSVISGITDDWQIKNVHCVVRDNAANMVLAFELSDLDDFGCFCHILHLVVKHSILQQSGIKIMRKKVRKLVKRIMKPKAKAIFARYQAIAGVPINSLKLSCKTRWNSDYTMFERMMQQKQAIKLVEDDTELKIDSAIKLTPNDWDLIPKLMNLLKPVYQATLLAEKEHACISDVIPITKRMIMEIKNVHEFGIGTTKNAFFLKII